MKLGCAIFLLVCLVILTVNFVGTVLGDLPGFEQVDGDQAFVYPTEDGQVALVLASGEYTVSGSRVDSGCYWLQPAKADRNRGTASKVWFFCGK